jgi:hypothetical protein
MKPNRRSGEGRLATLTVLDPEAHYRSSSRHTSLCTEKATM